MPNKSIRYNASEVFNPAASIFVSANAGAGKTSLLTNRVLALLLSGVDPSKILCLTYTHAAASEMATRILEKLGKWVMSDDAALTEEISGLASENPTPERLLFARGLFAKVLEAPDAPRIQTIHSFCQSLLRRFPLEAMVSPHFNLMDARTEQEFLQEASLRLFTFAQQEDPRLQVSLNAISQRISESTFHNVLAEIVRNKRKIRSLFALPDGVVRAEEKLRKLLNIPNTGTVYSLMEKYFAYDGSILQNLRSVCARISTSTLKTDIETAAGLAEWLEKGHENSAAREKYINVFITAEGAKRKKLFTQKAALETTDADLLLAEQERVWGFINECKALETSEYSSHILHLADALLALYDKLKSNHALIDYDDLILTARNLLQQPDIAPWILYKLDGGIEHILVDEAQDTSPEQWDIVEALTEEFFAGMGKNEQDRSLFVVGDEKQSIYSFQGAQPKALAQKEHDFSTRIRDAAKPLHKINLTHSFRSTAEILTIVDSIFSQNAASDGVISDSVLQHIPTRLQHPGLVELWPLAEPLLDGGEISVSSKTNLARNIVSTIRGWLDNGLWLESKGRCVMPGDIMILIRKRSAFVDTLVRTLKRHNIPVAGNDRMALGDNLAVQDLMALGQCLLLPEDDLTLAALLKSPIFGLSEETLFLLCSDRGKKTLWERLREVPSVSDAYKLLADLRAKADTIPPYELYAYVLESQGARRRFIGRMGEEYNDAIDEFLGQALLYERSHTPSLQGFMHWLAASDSEIKRDMEQVKGCIRIMTIHGAKGLQSPIVMLPDTVDVPRIKDTLVWYNDGSGGIPFWPATAKKRDSFTAELLEKQKQDMLAEYRRLLYVALTRAEDRLYITGFRPHYAVSEQSWYHLIENGMKLLATPFDFGKGQGLRYGNPPSFADKYAISENMHDGQNSCSNENFAFLHRSAPLDPLPSQPLAPSHLALEEPAANSPLSANKTNLFQRGHMIHRLLQYLPHIDASERMEIANSLAYHPTVSDTVKNDCIAEVLRVMDNPMFSFLFTKDGLSEVPVAGCVSIGGRKVAVAGQIDRLYIGEKEVWIIDYKSAQKPFNSSIPVAYGKQMALYWLLLKEIYPDKHVKCALLWTPDASITLLDEALLSSYIW